MREFLRFLSSELRLVAGRRRNQVGLVVLIAVPIFVAVVTKFSGEDGGSGFFGQITDNGVFVGFAALTIESGLFLPMGIAMISGDAVAGEAHNGTLRYLLTVPVSRARLLAVKYLAIVITGLVGAVSVALAGALVGALLFGTGPLVTLSGSQISLGEGVWRLLIAAAYLSAGLAALGAIGLFVSTLTEQPIAVTVVVMVIAAGSWVLDSIPGVAVIHPWLLVDRWLAMADIMRDPPLWTAMLAGLAVDAAYAVVFLLAAWASFGNRDVTS